MLRSFQNVDVWHFPVDYDVGYNNQDVLVSRELVAQPAPPGELCYIRFDLVRGEGDYSYGFKPPELDPSRPLEWGVWVKQRGTVLNQQRSVLKMNVIYFYIEGPKTPTPRIFAPASKQLQRRRPATLTRSRTG